MICSPCAGVIVNAASLPLCPLRHLSQVSRLSQGSRNVFSRTSSVVNALSFSFILHSFGSCALGPRVGGEVSCFTSARGLFTLLRCPGLVVRTRLVAQKNVNPIAIGLGCYDAVSSRMSSSGSSAEKKQQQKCRKETRNGVETRPETWRLHFTRARSIFSNGHCVFCMAGAPP